MKAEDVKPKDWCLDDYEIKVLYDDEETGFSAIWGKYKGKKTLGVRWNGDSENSLIGTPGRGKYPLWLVIPHYISVGIIHRLHDLTTDKEYKKYCKPKNIEFAMQAVLEEIRKENM